ncbi:SPASM domain-containing protein [Parenemella sanctibonifatiensis]|nr:SPASM domain-containing protein [Parenemella sanctibonifatiensis]
MLPNTLASVDAMLGLLQGIVDYTVPNPDGGEDYSVEAVSFSGLIGEPLSSKAAVTEGIHFLADHGKRIGLFTNAELMDDKVRAALLRASYVNISLDAGKPETYALLKFEGRASGMKKFDRVLNNVRALTEEVATSGSPLTVNASFIMYPETHHELYDAAAALHAAGVRTLRLKRDISGDRLLNADQVADTVAQIERIRRDLVDESFDLIEVHHIGEPVNLRRHFTHCRITDLMAAVGSDGCMYPCNYHPRPNGHSYGSVLEGKFRDVWEGAARADYRAGRLPRDCPKVCDPYKNRANGMLEVIADIYEQQGQLDDAVAFARSVLVKH